jgi:hypothetical protein
MSCVHIETKFLWLFRAVEVGDDVNGWQVCWLGGWDKCRVMFVVIRIPLREYGFPDAVFAQEHR